MKRFVREQTSERLKKVQAELRHAADEPEDADAIHDLRVSIRRLNQDLRVFKAWFQASHVKKIRRHLKKLKDRCGAVRNCDIAIEVLRAAGCEDQAVWQGLEKERRRTNRKLRRTLETWQRKDRAGKWRKHLEPKGPKSAPKHPAEAARGILPAMTDALFGAGQDAAKAGSTHHAMHRFRLTIKRVRYTLELFAPLYGAETDPITEPLKGLQEKLGAINDCAATLVMVQHNPAAAAAVRGLAEKRESEFRKYWKLHFEPRTRVQWKSALAGKEKELDGNLHSEAR